MADNSKMQVDQEPHCSTGSSSNVSNNEFSINVLYTNICSLNTNKNDLLYEVSVSEPDIVILTETHLKQEEKDFNIQIPGYLLYRLDRNTSAASRGGGIAIYIAEKINDIAILRHTIKEKNGPPSKIEVLWLFIKIGNTLLSVAGVYRPPNTNISTDKELTEFLNECLNEASDITSWYCYPIKYRKYIIAGDFNSKLNWEANQNKTNTTEDRFRYFIEKEKGFIQGMPERTRVGFTSKPNWLDLIFHKNFGPQHQVTTGPPVGKSDHMTVYFQAGNPRNGEGIWSDVTRNNEIGRLPEIHYNSVSWSKIWDIISATEKICQTDNGWSPSMNTRNVMDMRTRKEEAWKNYKRFAMEYENACNNLEDVRKQTLDFISQRSEIKLQNYIESKLYSDAPELPITQKQIEKWLTDVDLTDAVEKFGITNMVLRKCSDRIAKLIEKILMEQYRQSLVARVD